MSSPSTPVKATANGRSHNTATTNSNAKSAKILPTHETTNNQMDTTTTTTSSSADAASGSPVASKKIPTAEMDSSPTSSNGGAEVSRNSSSTATTTDVNATSVRISNAMWLSDTDDAKEALKKYINEELYEGSGECFLVLGQEPGENIETTSTGFDKQDEMPRALATLTSIAAQENFVIADVLDRDCLPTTTAATSTDSSRRRIVKTLFLRRRVEECDFHETRIAVVGNVDAGKSTLLGVLTHAELDNGRGLARQKLFRHKHEIESGRTSSVGNDILGFDAEGNIVNSRFIHHGGGGNSGGTAHQLDWSKICESSQKVITFIDLAGHEKYLKTTVFGMTGHAPDYCMLVVGANAGAIGMMKEHLSLALALKVPVYVVVTKADMAPKQVLEDTLASLHRILTSPGCAKKPLEIKNLNAVIAAVNGIGAVRGAIAPIFLISSVTGDGLDRLIKFLNFLPCRMRCDTRAPALFQIDETYTVPGVGTVISGTCLQGRISVGDNNLKLGPDSTGNFMPMPIRSIHRKRMNVQSVQGGQSASFALKKIKRNNVRKGMVLAAAALQPRAVWQFIGRIIVLHHPTTMHAGYQAMVHVGATRQTATLIAIENKEYLRTGDKAQCRFEFMKQPEFLLVGERLVFREGRTKAVGQVMSLCADDGGEMSTTSTDVAGKNEMKLNNPTTMPTNNMPNVPIAAGLQQQSASAAARQSNRNRRSSAGRQHQNKSGGGGSSAANADKKS